jgi:hypothetical protein
MAIASRLAAPAALIRLLMKSRMVSRYLLFVFWKKRDDLPKSTPGQNHPALVYQSAFRNPKSALIV